MASDPTYLQCQGPERRRVGALLSSLIDLWSALRMLVKNPGLTAAALLALAIGVGVNSLIFSVVNDIFLRPIPLASQQDRLVLLCRTLDGRSFRGFDPKGGHAAIYVLPFSAHWLNSRTKFSGTRDTIPNVRHPRSNA